MVFVDPRLALWLADGNRRRQLHFGHSKILFGEIASNRRQNFLPSPLVMVKTGMVKKIITVTIGVKRVSNLRHDRWKRKT